MTAASANPYDSAFYERETEVALESARVVIPILLTLIQPRTAIDIGCGRGAWLRALRENNVETVRGLDGPWVDPSKILIDASSFQPIDLDRPLEIHESYDLALCLEVVEHLPYLTATRLIRTLTTVSPLVLFSAAIPGQGGTGHINEQWPSFWRSEFARHGFVRLDAIRPRILHDQRVAWWYRQNIFLYASPDVVAASSVLRAEPTPPDRESLEIIRHDILKTIVRRRESFRGLFAETQRAGLRAIQRRFYQLLEQSARSERLPRLHTLRSVVGQWTSRFLSMRNKGSR
jgi:SAM-dependent methyltransferase